MSDKILLSIQIDPETRRRLRILAAETGLPIRALITRQIDNLLASADSPLPQPSMDTPDGPHRLR